MLSGGTIRGAETPRHGSRPERAPGRSRAKAILVTGAHRSGTGWVARMLCAAPTDTAYLWEPFSPKHRPGTCARPFPLWFAYVCEENAAAYEGPIRDMLAFRYRPVAELRAVRRPGDLARLARDWSRFAAWRRANAVPVLKDPIAVFSAEWLADRFDLDVVVLIRHPAAFAASLKRLSWTHPFDHFLEQPLLMRDLLGPFEEEIRAQAAREADPVDQAIMLWKLVHHAVQRYRDRRPEWTFVRLEDLALDPVGRFAGIYDRLSLEFGARAEGVVREHSESSLPVVAKELDSVKRNSAGSISAWKSILSEEEVARVRSQLEPMWREFYADNEW